MKTTITILILLLTFSVQSFACECPEYEMQELDNESYNWSDLVIIGTVIKTGINYQIEVTEVLKGNVNEEIIYGTLISEGGIINSCSFYPNDKGEYLFYLKRTDKKGQIFYSYSQCLGSRKLNFDSYPISLQTDKTKSELIAETEKWIDQLRKGKK